VKRTYDLTPSDDLNNYKYTYDPGEPSGGLSDVFWGYGGVELYQNGVGACAGFSGAGWLATMRDHSSKIKAMVPNVDHGTGYAIYHEAQKRDEWAGESYEGTSINAVCKVLKALGLITGWAWCNTWDAYLSALRKGPILRGWDWYESMERTDAQGFINNVSGANLGGHATLVTGHLISFGNITTHRNWWQLSPRYLWGHDGNFYMRTTTDKQLFDQRPEAALLYPVV
jgi:hypothetical protein